MASGGAGAEGGGAAAASPGVPTLEDSEIEGPMDVVQFVKFLQSEKEKELEELEKEYAANPDKEEAPLKEVFLCLVKGTLVKFSQFARKDVVASIVPDYFSWEDETQRIARSKVHMKVKFLRKIEVFNEVTVELPTPLGKINLFVRTDIHDPLRQIKLPPKAVAPPSTPERGAEGGRNAGGAVAAEGGRRAGGRSAGGGAAATWSPFRPRKRKTRKQQKQRKQRKTQRKQQTQRR
jgi:uncharacterized membrane protein YgcG